MTFVRALLGLLIFSVNTVTCCLLLYVFAILKVLIPIKSARAVVSQVIVFIAESWISINNFASDKVQGIDWNINGKREWDKSKSYLIVSNHRSWSDIFIIQKVLNRKVPFLRFFIKQELIWVPFLGPAWWALDFPRVRRYSKEYLEKYPEKKGTDVLTTQRACEKFRGNPVSVLNFVEGTRLTEEKHAKSQSSFKNLLPPKSGGVATVLQSMGDQFDSLIDLTIVYPDGDKNLLELIMGLMTRVTVEVRKYDFPEGMIEKLRHQDTDGYTELKTWLNQIWLEKDQSIENHL